MDIERVFAIGDIHGCLDKLVPLINMIKWNPDQDLLLFIGDYIDRGGHSREVVDYLVDLKQRLPENDFLIRQP
jgi:serine/threonine protein phosphatase 1